MQEAYKNLPHKVFLFLLCLRLSGLLASIELPLPMLKAAPAVLPLTMLWTHTTVPNTCTLDRA